MGEPCPGQHGQALLAPHAQAAAAVPWQADDTRSRGEFQVACFHGCHTRAWAHLLGLPRLGHERPPRFCLGLRNRGS